MRLGRLSSRRHIRVVRHYCPVPSARDQYGCEVAALRGVLAPVLGMICDGVMHVAVESFGNGLWPGYKTGAGIDVLAQSHCSKTPSRRLASSGRWWRSRRTMRSCRGGYQLGGSPGAAPHLHPRAEGSDDQEEGVRGEAADTCNIKRLSSRFFAETS
jgi:hypothetical protein